MRYVRTIEFVIPDYQTMKERIEKEYAEINDPDVKINGLSEIKEYLDIFPDGELMDNIATSWSIHSKLNLR